MSNYLVFIEYEILESNGYSDTKVFSCTVSAKDGSTAMAYVLTLFNSLSNYTDYSTNVNGDPYLKIDDVSFGNA